MPSPVNEPTEVIDLLDSDDDVVIVEKEPEVWKAHYKDATCQTIVVRPDITINAQRKSQESTPVPVEIDRDVIGRYRSFLFHFLNGIMT